MGGYSKQTEQTHRCTMKIQNYPQIMICKFGSCCCETGQPLRKGERIVYDPRNRKGYHMDSKFAFKVWRAGILKAREIPEQ